MLIPKPLDVEALIRRSRKERAAVEQVRERLAKDFHTDFTCLLTTGIFIRVAAEVAEEDLSKGEMAITPCWLGIKVDGSLNEKLPGRTEAQAACLREEGNFVELGKGKKTPNVKDCRQASQEL